MHLDRKAVRSKRSNDKQELSNIGVLPRPWVIVYSLEAKGAKGSKKKDLPVRLQT